jgi:hypothetical protein
VPSIEPASKIIPAEGPAALPPSTPRTVIIIHAGPWSHGNRQASLPAKPRRQSPRRGGKHRADDSSLLDLPERVLTSWPITLRLALLLLILLTGTAVIAAAAGLVNEFLLAALSYCIRHKLR